MIPLTNKHKLSFRTPPSFKREVARLLESLIEDEVKYGKRKIANEALLNSILLDFLEKSPQERKDIVRRCVKTLYELKEPVNFADSFVADPPGGKADPTSDVRDPKHPDAGAEANDFPIPPRRRGAR